MNGSLVLKVTAEFRFFIVDLVNIDLTLQHFLSSTPFITLTSNELWECRSSVHCYRWHLVCLEWTPQKICPECVMARKLCSILSKIYFSNKNQINLRKLLAPSSHLMQIPSTTSFSLSLSIPAATTSVEIEIKFYDWHSSRFIAVDIRNPWLRKFREPGYSVPACCDIRAQWRRKSEAGR